jgi:hypothetical protein
VVVLAVGDWLKVTVAVALAVALVVEVGVAV